MFNDYKNPEDIFMESIINHAKANNQMKEKMYGEKGLVGLMESVLGTSIPSTGSVLLESDTIVGPKENKIVNGTKKDEPSKKVDGLTTPKTGDIDSLKGSTFKFDEVFPDLEKELKSIMDIEDDEEIDIDENPMSEEEDDGVSEEELDDELDEELKSAIFSTVEDPEEEIKNTAKTNSFMEEETKMECEKSKAVSDEEIYYLQEEIEKFINVNDRTNTEKKYEQESCCKIFRDTGDDEDIIDEDEIDKTFLFENDENEYEYNEIEEDELEKMINETFVVEMEDLDEDDGEDFDIDEDEEESISSIIDRMLVLEEDEEIESDEEKMLEVPNDGDIDNDGTPDVDEPHGELDGTEDFADLDHGDEDMGEESDEDLDETAEDIQEEDAEETPEITVADEELEAFINEMDEIDVDEDDIQI